MLSVAWHGTQAQVCEPCGGVGPSFALAGASPIQPGCSGEVSFNTTFTNSNNCDLSYILTLTFSTGDDPGAGQVVDYFNNLGYVGNIPPINDLVSGPVGGTPATRVMQFAVTLGPGETGNFTLPFDPNPPTGVTPNSDWGFEFTLTPFDPQSGPCPNEEAIGTGFLDWQESFIVIRGNKGIQELFDKGTLPSATLIDRSVVLLPEIGGSAPPTLTIDVPSFSFVPLSASDDLILSPGATVLVKGGSTLSLTNVRVHGCTALARGIVLEKGATLNLDGGNTVGDCHTGVEAAPGSSLNSTGTLFLNNRVGINLDMAAAPSGSRRLALLNLSNNTFDSGALLPPSLPEVTGSQGYCGINLARYEHFNVYGTNTFRNMANGLVVEYSILNIGNMSFANMQPLNEGYPLEGFGIHLKGERSGFSWANVNELWTNMTFANCQTGVRGKQYPGKVDNTDMSAVVNGIDWESSADMTLHFRENRVTAQDFGIRSFMNEPLRGGLGINKNTVNITGVSNPNRLLAGIKADEGAFASPTLRGWNILLNRVNMAAGGEGIGYRNGIKGSIADNPSILNADRRFFYNAVRIDNAMFTGVTGNSLGQTAFGIVGFGVSNGVESSAGVSNVFACNGFDNTNFGLFFRDMADFSNGVAGNCFNCHGAGLKINAGAFVGEQYHTGNAWDLFKINTCGSGIGAINDGNPDRSRFFVDGFEDPKFNPPATPATGWFTNESTPEPTDVCPSCAAPRATPGPTDSDKGLTDLDVAIVSGQLTGTVFPAEEAWKADYRLARKLLRNPGYVGESPAYAAFKSETDATSVGQLAYLSEAKSALFQLSPSEETTAGALWGQLMAQTSEIRRLDSLRQAGGAVEAGVYAALLAENADTRGQYDQFWTARETARTAQINTLLAYNAAITTTLDCDNNHKTLNALVLNWLKAGMGTPDGATLSSLQTIAAQCPLKGGDAVYEARAFVSHFTGNTFDDDTICAAAEDREMPQARRAVALKGILYPNPSTGTLQWSGGNAPAMAWVFDALGRLQAQAVFNAGRIELGHLPSGGYSVQLLDATGGLLTTQKVVLQK